MFVYFLAVTLRFVTCIPVFLQTISGSELLYIFGSALFYSVVLIGPFPKSRQFIHLFLQPKRAPVIVESI